MRGTLRGDFAVLLEIDQVRGKLILYESEFLLTTKMGVIGFDGDQEVNGACRALGVSLNLRETIKCQRTIGSRGLIDRDVSPFLACGYGRGDD